MLADTFIESRKSVLLDLNDFLAQAEADELMVASYIYDFDQRLKSYRLIAETITA